MRIVARTAALILLWLVFESMMSWAAFCTPAAEKYECFFRGPLALLFSELIGWWQGVFGKADKYVALFTATAYKIAVAVGTFLDTHNGAFTALATLAVAAFTFTLWRSTKGMLATTNNSINLARDEFISTHRPKLIVRQFQIDPVTPGNPITIHFAMVNIGSTEARPRLLGCQIALWNVQGNYFEAPGINATQDEINVPPIAGGQRVSWRMVSTFPVTPQQIGLIQSGSLLIQILGEITYKDGLNRQRRTGFRRSYDRLTDKFIPSPNSEEEYQD